MLQVLLHFLINLLFAIYALVILLQPLSPSITLAFYNFFLFASSIIIVFPISLLLKNQKKQKYKLVMHELLIES